MSIASDPICDLPNHRANRRHLSATESVRTVLASIYTTWINTVNTCWRLSARRGCNAGHMSFGHHVKQMRFGRRVKQMSMSRRVRQMVFDNHVTQIELRRHSATGSPMPTTARRGVDRQRRSNERRSKLHTPRYQRVLTCTCPLLIELFAANVLDYI